MLIFCATQDMTWGSEIIFLESDAISIYQSKGQDQAKEAPNNTHVYQMVT